MILAVSPSKSQNTIHPLITINGKSWSQFPQQKIAGKVFIAIFINSNKICILNSVNFWTGK